MRQRAFSAAVRTSPSRRAESKRPQFARPLAAALALVLLPSGGCEGVRWPWDKPPQPAVDAWCVSEMEKVSSLTPRRHDDLLVSPRTGAIELFAAANETVSFQVIVQADSLPLRNVRISCGQLRSGRKTIASEHFRCYRLLPMRIADYPAWYLRLTETAPQPAEFYDAMVPAESALGGQPFQVEHHQRLLLWVDLYVPRGTEAGEYAGEISVTAENRQAWTAQVRVHVYDLVLPDARAIAAVGGFDHDVLLGRLIQREGKPFVPAFLDRSDPAVRRGLTVIRQLMQVGHDHRLDLFDTAIRPILKRGPAGEVRLDWTDYDAIVRPYLDGSAFADRVGSPAWPSPFWAGWPDPAAYGGASVPAYAETAKAVIALCRDHFQDEDVRTRIFLWPSRGQPVPAGYDEFMHLAELVRSVDGRTPILSDLPASVSAGAGRPAGDPNRDGSRSGTPPEGYRQLVDIQAPPGHWLEPHGVVRPDPNGPAVGVWLAPGWPPHFPSLGVLAGPADVRAIPWIAMKYGCAGLLVPDVLDWSAAPFQNAGPLQTTLFYPGTIAGLEGVMPSVRLKWLRRGLQDIAYLHVLRQRGHASIARRLLDAMVRYAGTEAAGDHPLDGRLYGWVKDPQLWTTVGRILAEETQQVVNPTELSERQLLAQRLAWGELRRRTATVRLEGVRTRVSGLRNAGGGEYLLATLTLELFNEHDQPVAPLLRVGPLPAGWECLDGSEVRLAPLPPGARKTAVLSLQGPEMPFSAAAKMEVPLSLGFPDGRQTKATAAVPALLASTVSRPPAIDGRLDDWPLRGGNRAGDFTVLGRRGHLDGGLANRQTQAYVLADERNLYIGIRCLEPNMAELVSRTDNLVRYEQLLACGEDLVEVLLDPGGRARSPEELYHILVKPSGIVITERGIGTALAPSRSSPWAAGVQAAVSRREGEWVVEMAVPLSAFGPAGKERFWGVNFARFATAGGESSNWAQTPRHLYHPRNLGTMYVPLLNPPAAKETSDGK